MQAWAFDRFGMEHLALVERERVVPGAGELLLRMAAVALNYRDLLTIDGRYNPRLRLPLVPCSDGLGIVEAIGPDVQGWEVGDRALPLFVPGWYDGDPDRGFLKRCLGGPMDGTLREFMVVRAEDALHAPSHLSVEESATLPCAGLTAWSALVEKGGVKPGETVLILGTGGVSVFALQFAKMLGAEVILTSGNAEKIQRARDLGADHVIHYGDHPNWEKEVLRITRRRGVDHVVEVGGMGTLERSVRSVRPGGSIYLIGVLAGREAPIDLTPVLMQNIRIQGIVVGHRRAFQEMNRAMELHQMRPVVDRCFPFAEARAALDHLRSGSHFGKVTVKGR